MSSLAKRLALRISAGISRDRGPKIVFYHDVFKGEPVTDMGTSLDSFRQHVDFALTQGFRYVKNVPSQNGELKVCFDDGFRGIYACADFFVERQIAPTVFIAPDLVGRTGHLTWMEIHELQSAGFDFQSHTWSHRPLTEVAPADYDHEIGDSRKCIADELSCQVSGLCFPCGNFSRAILDASVAAGYNELYTSVPGRIDCLQRHVASDDTARLLPRHLVQFFTAQEFGWVLNGALRPFGGRYLKMHVQGDLR